MGLRLRHRSRAAWFAARRLGPLSRSAGGWLGLARVALSHVGPGGGIEQFGIWCHDRLALLERQDVDLYRQWRERVEPGLPGAPAPAASEGVTVVLGTRRLEAVAETLKSLDIPANSACRLLLVVPPSELEPASSLVSSMKLTLLAGSQESDPEQLVLSALAGVESDYVLTLLPGASLAPNALVEIERAAVESGADLVYSDEDCVRDGTRQGPIFKPGASPDLLDAQDYVGPVCLFRTGRRLQQAGNGATCLYQIVRDHLHGKAVVERVPRILVHWSSGRDFRLDPRQAPEPSRPTSQGDAGNSSDPSSLVASIIVPTRDRADLLQECISSLYAHAQDCDFEVLVLDNGSREPETLRWLAEAPGPWPGLRVLSADYPFNWSQLGNQGAAAARGRVCVFLNNDVRAISQDWLSTLVRKALRDTTGAVGPLLLYPDDTIQHAGIVLGLGGLAGHVYLGCPASESGGFAFVAPQVPRNVLALTGACLAVRKDKFARLGGFDEELRICGDVDLCLRLHAAGYYNLFEPRARLYHRESATRRREPLGASESEAVWELFERELGAEDPFYNPNLNLRSRFPTFLQPFRMA